MLLLPRRLVVQAVVLVAVAFVGLATNGCGGSGTEGSSGTPVNPTGMPIGTLVPEFALPDVNPASGTFGMDVSPNLVRGSASAWYFGHST